MSMVSISSWMRGTTKQLKAAGADQTLLEAIAEAAH